MTEEQECDEVVRSPSCAPLESKRRGGPGRGQGRKPLNRVARGKLNVRIDPDLRILVQWHASTREQTVTESVNQLLAEALRTKEVDAEAQEVL